MSSTTSSLRQSPSSPFKSLTKSLKAHHESVNAAYQTYYGVPQMIANSPSASASSTPRSSLESNSSASQTQKGQESVKSGNGVWGKVKKAARDHQRSVDQAYAVYYGVGVAPVRWRE
ncbi:hypothetical protein BCR34DRAFT_601238 [Clohesyomyces aquaticus]|uniref:Uncharacterized protein n=1 Tax=Clohesyomyces aquaticus TaxID=1231657 RepID=A0A1Y1ZN58_9PLEO|nr:hypothetical protein BCR34DRAFT_601238 [Clohesyomyces aquaticus]